MSLNSKPKMRAAVLVSPGKWKIQSVPVPEPGPGQVRIRVEGCGICGSNNPPWEGRPWFQYPFVPGAPGHEAWGEIDALGEGVKGLAPGLRVTGLNYNGFAEMDVARAEEIVPLPPALEKKPFPGEALGCAMNVFRRSRIQPGQTVAVVGIGFLGAILAGLAVKAGARVFAISRRSFALKMARQEGVTETLAWHGNNSEIVNQVKKETGERGCDRVIEAVGCQEALDLAGELTCEKGRLIIAGYHQDGLRQVNMQLWNWRGLDVINAHERDPQTYLDGIRIAVEGMRSGSLDPSPLYTHSFKLEHIQEAFETANHRPDGFLKAFITL